MHPGNPRIVMSVTHKYTVNLYIALWQAYCLIACPQHSHFSEKQIDYFFKQCKEVLNLIGINFKKN